MMSNRERHLDRVYARIGSGSKAEVVKKHRS